MKWVRGSKFSKALAMLMIMALCFQMVTPWMQGLTYAGELNDRGSIALQAVNPGTLAPRPVTINLVSKGYGYDYDDGGNAESSRPAVSSDGRYVAFISSADNLIKGSEVVGDTTKEQVYLHDRKTGLTVLVSSVAGSFGIPSNGESRYPSISADGRYVAFESDSSNLVPDDFNNSADVFVWDRDTKQTRLVSVSEAGGGSSDGRTIPSISSDGKFVMFGSEDPGLDKEGLSENSPHVYRADLQTGEMKRLNRQFHGLFSAIMSGNGRYIIYEGDYSLYAYDFESGRTKELRISTISENQTGPYYNLYAVSENGRYVAYWEGLWEDSSTPGFVKVLDRELAPEVPPITIGPLDSFQRISLSPDGQFVVFVARTALYPDLAPEGTLDQDYDLFVADRSTGKVRMASDESVRSLVDNPVISNTGVVVFNDYQDVMASYESAGTIGWPSNAALRFESVGGNVRLSWPDPENTNTEGFQVYSLNRNGYRTFLGYAAPDSRFFDLSDMEVDEGDRFEVRALNSAFNSSARSLSGSFELADTSPPYWVGGNAGVEVGDIVKTTAKVVWKAAIDDEYGQITYKVWRHKDGERILLHSSPNAYVYLANLDPGTTYTITVQPVDTLGNWGNDSAPVTFSTLAEDVVIGELSADYISGKVALSWSAAGLATGTTVYKVYRAASGGSLAEIAERSSSVTSYEDSQVGTGLFFYQVRGFNAAGDVTFQTNIAPVSTGSVEAPVLTTLLPPGENQLPMKHSLVLNATAQAGQEVSVIVRYESWLDSAGRKRAYPRKEEIRVQLEENEERRGTYTGTWTMPDGVSVVLSAQAALHNQGGQVLGAPVQINRLVEAAVEVAFSLSHLSEQHREQLERALVGTNLEVQLGAQQTAITQPFTGFGQKYTFAGLNSEGEAVIALGSYFKGRQFKLQSGLVQTVLLSNVNINPTLTIAVKDTKGKPIRGLEVTFTDLEGDVRFRGITNEQGETGTASLPVMSGRVSVGVKGTSFAQQEPRAVALSIVPIREEFTMEEQAKVRLHGRIADKFSTPIDKVTVSALQKVNEQYVINKGVTDSNGLYSIDVYPGEAEITMNEYGRQNRFPNHTKVQVTEQGAEYNPIAERYTEGIVLLKLFYKRLDGTIEGPFSMDQASMLKWNMVLRDAYGLRDGYSEYPIRTYGYAGDEIELCMYNFQNFDRICKKAVTDKDNSALIELTVEEEARLQARIVQEGALYLMGDAYLTLERWVEENQRWEHFRHFNANPLTVSIPSGKYRYNIYTSNGASPASGEFEAKKNEIVNLGNLPLIRFGVFSGRAGNGLTAAAAQALPGETITLRGAFKNTLDTIAGATLKIDVPPGTELVDGSAVVQYKDAAPIVMKGTQFILGNMQIGDGGTVTYKLKLSEAYARSQVDAKLSISWSGGEEVIGRRSIPTSLIEMEAPGTVYSDLVQLSGRAPGGSTVTIFDGDMMIGQTVAHPGGYWAKAVQLADHGKPSRHMLRAETIVDGKHAATEPHVTVYEPDVAQLQELIMKQFNGKEVVIQPENGVAKFPFTLHPNLATSFAAKFSDPGLVETVRIRFAGEPEEMEKGEDGVFRADIVPGYRAGAVYIEYKTKKERALEQPGDQLKSKLPPHLRDFEQNAEVIQSNPETGSQGGVKFEMGGYRINSETFELPDDGYEMTEEEAQAVADNRAPAVFGPNLDWQIDGTILRLNLTYYVAIDDQPVSQVKTLGPNVVRIQSKGKGLKKRSQRIDVDVENVRDIDNLHNKLKEMNESVETGIGVVDAIRENFDAAIDYGDRMDRLATLSGIAATCPKVFETWNPHIQKRMQITTNLTVVTRILSIADFLNPIPFDKVGLDPFGDAIDAIEENMLDKPVESLESYVRYGINIHCKPDDGDFSEYSGSGGSGSDEGGGSGGGWKGGKAAEPVYIYDPSGYIYEAVPDNRIEGATTTVYQLLNGSWAPWDADWFGQMNPQSTDAEGKYGWDVPFGTWKVAVEHEGYLPAESRELVVPPQHFDVHIPIISLDPPSIQEVQAWSTGTEGEVTIRLTKYVDAVLIGSDTVAVSGQNGLVTGQVEAVNIKKGADNKDLTSTIRFISSSGLKVGDILTVFLDGTSVVSYAGIPMNADEQRQVTVTAKDVTAPILEAVSLGKTGKEIRLIFNEAIDPASLRSVEGITLSGTKALPTGLVRDSAAPDGRTVKLLLSGSIQAKEVIKLSYPGGLFRDAMANAAQAINALEVNNMVPSRNTSLKSVTLYLDGVPSVVPFNAAMGGYKAEVPLGSVVALSASTAEAGSTVHIGEKLYRESPIKIAAEQVVTNLPITVTAPDGMTKKVYSLAVNRVPVPPKDPESETSVSVGSPPERTVQLTEQKDGTKTAQYRYTNQGVRSIAANDSITLELKETADRHTAVMPLAAAREQIGANGMLIVRTNAAVLNVPVSGSQLLELSEALKGSGNEPELHLNFVKVKGAPAEATLPAAASAEGKFRHSSEYYELAMEARSGAKAMPIQASSGKPIQGQLVWTSELETRLGTKGVGIYYFDEAASGWQWTPSRLERESSTVVFKSPAGLRFAVLSYTPQFNDLSQHWGSKEIEALASKHIVKGTKLHRFDPDRPVNRAEFTAMLTRALGLKGEMKAGLSFSDVSDNDWFHHAVIAAASVGVVEGFDGGAFRPQDTITREQMAVMMIRALSVAGGQTAHSSEDAPRQLERFVDRNELSAWAQEAVAISVHAGLITGKEGSRLSPAEQATRAEAAAVIERWFARIPLN